MNENYKNTYEDLKQNLNEDMSYDDLILSSKIVERPNKENNANKPYSFPKYVEKLDHFKNLFKITSNYNTMTADIYTIAGSNSNTIVNSTMVDNIEASSNNPVTNNTLTNNLVNDNTVDDTSTNNLNNNTVDDTSTNSLNNNLTNHIVNDSVNNKIDWKFKIFPDKILDDKRTTCMIKNIPNKYTVTNLIEFINETHFSKYDFLYLRMDFKNNCNVGYAFINFIDQNSLLEFYNRINGKRWKNVGSLKIAELTYASIQGLENLINKFKRSSVMMEEERFRPKVFYVNGEKKGYERKDIL